MSGLVVKKIYIAANESFSRGSSCPNFLMILKCMRAADSGPVNSASEKYAGKVPLQLKCSKCGEPASIKIHLDATTFDWTCPKCGSQHQSLFGLDVTIGFLILDERSRYELCIEQDSSMSVRFAISCTLVLLDARGQSPNGLSLQALAVLCAWVR